jgi:hypothetical protein
MMRCFLALLLATANAQECSLDSSNAVAHSVNAALEIWASDLRCKGSILKEAPIKCVQDISGAIAELTQVGIAVGGMATACGDLKIDNGACVKAGEEVFSATSGLTHAAAAMADHCDKALSAEDASDHAIDTATVLGQCTANAAASMNNLFAAHNSIQKVKKACDDSSSDGCKVEAMDVTAVLADWGAYISEAYAHCDRYNRKQPADSEDTAAECAAAVLEAVSGLTRFAELGSGMHKACASASRLYLNEKIAAGASGSPLSMTAALAVTIPLAAVLSFIAGSRFAKSRQQRDAAAPGMLESVE